MRKNLQKLTKNMQKNAKKRAAFYHPVEKELEQILVPRPAPPPKPARYGSANTSGGNKMGRIGIKLSKSVDFVAKSVYFQVGKISF